MLRQLSRRHHFSNDITARENDHREVETPASLRTLTPCYTAPRGRSAKHARKNQKYIVDHRGIVDEPSRHISDAEAHQLRIRRCTRATCRHVGCRRNATDGQKCGRASTSISLYVSSMIEAGLKWNNATRRQRQVNTSNATELRQRCFNV